MKIVCERKFQICAGHRVHEHESKCRHPHGHNYIIWVTAEGVDKPLDNLGRVIDFSVIKEVLGDWLDSNWDHGFIYWKEDKQMANIFQDFKSFPMPYNPTAENMAKYLLWDICPKLFKNHGITISKVRIYETENCVAEVSNDVQISVGWIKNDND